MRKFIFLFLPAFAWAQNNGIQFSYPTQVSGVSPVIVTNNTVVSMPAAGSVSNGYLTSTDWNTFSSKLSNPATTFTATGSVTTPTLYGSSSANGTLQLAATSSPTPGVINIGATGDQVYVVNQTAINVLNKLKGDGVTDDHTALQNLFNSSPNGSTFYIPVATYNFTAGVTVTDKQFNIISDYATFQCSFNGPLITVNSSTYTTASAAKWNIDKVKFKGTSTGNSQNAINFSQYAGHFNITNCEFSGFGASGIASALQISATNFTNTLGGNVTGCKFYSNYQGIYLNTAGEYINFESNDIWSNTTAFFITSGNCIISNNNINYNGTGIYGLAGSNNAHGIISGNNMNHNTNYTLRLENQTYGWTISNNHIYQGFVKFKQSNGIVVTGGIMDVDNYEYDAAVGTVFNGVTFDSAYVNSTTLTSGSLPVYNNCRKLNGSYATSPNTFLQSVRPQVGVCLTSTVSLNFPSTSPNTVSSLTVAVSGAADGDPVDIGVPVASQSATNVTFLGTVTSAGVVTIYFQNNNLIGSIDPAIGTFRVRVNKN